MAQDIRYIKNLIKVSFILAIIFAILSVLVFPYLQHPKLFPQQSGDFLVLNGSRNGIAINVDQIFNSLLIQIDEKGLMRIMSQRYTLKKYYIRYLEEIRYNSKSTINHYLSALEVISRYLVQKKQIKISIYEIIDLDILRVIKENLHHDPVFVEKDERGHRMYSAALNNYFRFASGENFSQVCDKIHIMDMPIPKSEEIIQTTQTPGRSSIIKNQVIMFSGYTCEIDKTHKTFTSNSTKESYMEGHHIIPISKQNKFLNSLDVYANIVSLCPICHRLLHYGICEEKTEFLEKIYNMRSDRLYNSGLKISRDDFMHISL